MIRIVARILCGLSITLALAFASVMRLEAASACPFASTTQTGPAHHDMPAMSYDTAVKAALTHHGHPAVPEPCKHGCNAVAFLVPPETVSPAVEKYLAMAKLDTPDPVSRPIPPFERPPKRVT